MDPLKIIQKYYKKDSELYRVLVGHSKVVTKKALEIAESVPQFHPDKKFIAEAAMLHDIGIFLTKHIGVGCTGDHPYICHGILGREILEKEGLPKHALVCERHIGVGLSVEDIEKQKLPLLKRAMLPVTTEEEIICLADKFFSKTSPILSVEHSLKKMREEEEKFGEHKVKKLNELLKKYGF